MSPKRHFLKPNPKATLPLAREGHKGLNFCAPNPKATLPLAREGHKGLRRNILLALCVLALAFGASADDGMWMPHQMTALDLQALGLRMDPAAMYRTDGTGLMNAVVNLGGGTGEFVSPEGLILTNHHVAFGAIQRAASKEHDYITDGFLAADRAAEIPAQGYTANVLLGYQDVTARVNAVLKPKMTPRQRYDAIEKVQKALVAAAEKGAPDLRAEVASMYSGNQYYLYTFKRLRDIRLVYAPPLDLGNFGGEVDNWMWPRHTCDFSFLRAYVAPDGTGAAYAAENVPYRPKSVLKLSLDGVAPGDFTFVMGNPGRTFRNMTSAELAGDIDGMRRRVQDSREAIAFYEAAGKSDKEVEIRYASRVKGLYNGLKNQEGKLEGFAKYDIVARKQGNEKAFLEWANADPPRAKKYAGALAAIEGFLPKSKAFGERTRSINSLTGGAFGSTILGQAAMIYRAVEQRAKPDAEREPGFQERNLASMRQNLQTAERGYVFATDRELMKVGLRRILALPADQVPAAVRAVKPEAADAYVEDLYAKTKLGDPKVRQAYFDMKPADLLKTGDPFILLAADLEKEMKGLREEGKSLNQEQADLHKTYEAALLEWKAGKISPDANGTIRFTYGPVEAYAPRDAVVYEPVTTLTGVLQKDTGVAPFHVPEKIKALAKARDFGRYMDKRLNDVPACFLNTTNVTGGNSGSPTFNAKGEQVGIIFDMTYESVVGDYLVIPELQRSISVDIRWVLFVTDKFSGAGYILKEMGL